MVGDSGDSNTRYQHHCRIRFHVSQPREATLCLLQQHHHSFSILFSIAYPMEMANTTSLADIRYRFRSCHRVWQYQ
jgi:hypothetical protein